MGKYLGIDVGGTFIKLGIIDQDGNVLMKREVPVDRSTDPEPVMDTLTRAADSILEDASALIDDWTGIAGIGVSAAGCIDSVKGAVAANGGNVPNWSFTEVARPLSERYGVTATLANDGNCVALAESWTGAAAGCDDVICVVLGTGLGGGIVSGGRLVEGSRGFAGEIGHFPVSSGNKADKACARRFDYENYAATSALIREAREADHEWKDGRTLFTVAAAGDRKALDVIDHWLDDIAFGLAGFVHIFDPKQIIIGGGVSAQQKLLIDPLREKLFEIVMPDFAEGLELKAASLGNDAGMVGAVRYLMSRIDRSQSKQN
ncbi:MAG: ROK family protein [Mogibacterium sp.]|nr:ROK family protein [Mogibacterium sp.]